MENWQYHEIHEEEVHKILIQHEAYIPGTRKIVAWEPTINKHMEEKGHTSLDFNKCACNTVRQLKI